MPNRVDPTCDYCGHPTAVLAVGTGEIEDEKPVTVSVCKPCNDTRATQVAAARAGARA
jgi:hypothetical protein